MAARKKSTSNRSKTGGKAKKRSGPGRVLRSKSSSTKRVDEFKAYFLNGKKPNLGTPDSKDGHRR